MAAERTDRERFSDRAAYERWTGDYHDDDREAYREPDRDAIAGELLRVMARNSAKQRLADACLTLAARIRREMPWPGDCRGAATVLENTAGDLREMVEETVEG